MGPPLRNEEAKTKPKTAKQAAGEEKKYGPHSPYKTHFSTTPPPINFQYPPYLHPLSYIQRGGGG